MTPLEIGMIGAAALVVLALAGVRIAFAAAAVGVAGLVAILGWDAGLKTAGVVPHAKSVNYTLSVLPMFILIGYLAFYAGITQAAFEACRRWFGWLPGGLAIATVFAVAGFSAVSGASTAAAAVFARVAIPEMLKNGYNRRLAAGVVAAGATLDSLIPPSALLVVYGIIVEESIGKLLIAGFVPGMFSALVYTAIIVTMCLRNPELGRPITGYTWGQRFRALPGTFPIVLVIGIIFTAMFYGWATPTEAGALGAFCVFVLALANGMRWPELKQALLDSARLTVMIFTIIWGVLIFVRFLGFANLPETIADWVVGLDVPPLVVLLVIYAIYLVLGMFMDKLCGIGLLTPPVGLCCFVVNGVRPDIPLTDIFRGIWPFVIADVITVAVLTAYPEIVTFILDFAY
jgi:tripartite ATP-independent transporter DctM subunit